MGSGRRSGFLVRQGWAYGWRPAVFVLILLLGQGVYWLQLQDSHTRMRDQVRVDTLRLGGQTAQALSLQMNTVVRKLDYFSQHLSWIWLQGNTAAFHDAAVVAINTLSAETLPKIAVADAQGGVLYSNLNWGKPESATSSTSIADREHFRVHAESDDGSFLFISDPIKGRISQQWTVQFARGLWQGGRFMGVLVMSVSVDYLTASLKTIFPDPVDAASLLKSDGTYLARSYYLAEVLGTQLPSSRPFIAQPEVNAGMYETSGMIDEIERLYSWQRVDDYPLVILVGLGSEKSMALINASIRDSYVQSAVGSALLSLAGLVLAWLWMQRSIRSAHLQRVAEALQASEARLRVTLEAVRDGLWRFDHKSRMSYWDERIRAMLGYDDSRALLPIDELIKLIHPQDLVRLRAIMWPDPSSTAVMNLEFRLRNAEERWVWVRARGGVVAHDEKGAPLRSVGTMSDISQLVAEAHLRDALLNRSAAIILLVSPDRRLVDANEQFISVFLKPGQMLKSLNLNDIHVDDARWEILGRAYEAVKGGESYHGEHPFKDAKGGIRWFATSAVLQNPEDPDSNIIWTWVDVTSRRQADEALAVETSRLNTVLERFPGGVLIKDAEGRVVFVNELWPQLLGVDLPVSSLRGLRNHQLQEVIGPDAAALLPLSEPGGAQRTDETITVDGRYLEVAHLDIQHDEQYFGSVLLLRDITDRKRHELKLTELASTDTLTGLPNRRSFIHSLNTLYDESLRIGTAGGVVMMLDIDRFKHVNDTYGHSTGDIVLQHVAQIMKASIRSTDVPGRLGGEEFVVLQPYTSIQVGLVTAERIRQRIEAAEIHANGQNIRITISIGISMVSANHDPETALQQADAALYSAKNSGRNRICLWEGLTTEKSEAGLALQE